MLLCSRCKTNPKPHGDTYCRACRNQYMRLWRQIHPKGPGTRADIAQSYANVYRRRGKLIPKPCETCGTTENLQIIIDDPSKPLEVQWFCRLHRMQERRRRAK